MNNEVSNREFAEILKKAKDGKIEYMYQIIKIYEKAIIKNSIVNGTYNQDCRDYIEEQIIKNIKKFKKI